MASLSTPQDAILYQNPAKTVALIDIPRSISLAQGSPSHPHTAQIFSSPALRAPFPSTEPKTEKAKLRLLKLQSQDGFGTQFPEASLRLAMEETSEGFEGKWCLERKLPADSPVRQGRKRKYGGERKQMTEAESASSVHHICSISSETQNVPGSASGGFHDPVNLSALIDSPNAVACFNGRSFANILFHNPCARPMTLKQAVSQSGFSNMYMIPSHASFFLSKINQETAPSMSMAALTMFSTPSATAGRGQFDFILLDPPWENRSVKRAAKYATMRESDPLEVLQSMLGQHIAPDGLIACWITNKPSVRDTALEAFEAWDVDLIEEWAWLKVTANGEPVTAIDGLWRKPYETLLIGRKRNQAAEMVRRELVRKVIVGVPDIHSRKPNLKALIDSMLPEPYRALEIFARNLTAGWWAWGDEVLKYATIQ